MAWQEPVDYEEILCKKDKEIEQYKHTLEHYTKEIKLLTAEIDQKDEETERLTKSNKGLGQGLKQAGAEIERLRKRNKLLEENMREVNKRARITPNKH